MINLIKRHNDIICGTAGLLALFTFGLGITSHIYGIYVLSEAKKADLQYELRDFKLRHSRLRWQNINSEHKISNVENITIEDIKILFASDEFCKFTLNQSTPKLGNWREVYPQMQKLMRLSNEIDELRITFWWWTVSTLGVCFLMIGFLVKKQVGRLVRT